MMTKHWKFKNDVYLHKEQGDNCAILTHKKTLVRGLLGIDQIMVSTLCTFIM